MSATSSELSYELRVGVTGHRTRFNAADVENAVRKLLDRIEKTLRRDRSIPLSWTIVSSLAKGADRIVTRAVLEREHSRLEAVWPFPLDDYRKDFDTDGDLPEFDHLRSRASTVVEMKDGVRDSQKERNEAYLRAGERVVDVSELIIAVWDGAPAAGAGGTGDIVHYAVQRERVVFWIDAAHPERPARLLKTAERPSESAVALPHDARALSVGYAQQASYCTDPALDSATRNAISGEMYARLKHAAEQSDLPFDDLESRLAPLVREFARADGLALIYQRRHVLLIRGVPLLASAAVTVAIAQVLFFPHQDWLSLFEIAAMILVLTTWWFGRHQLWHEKWLHARHLAERLRTAIFMLLVGSGSDSHEEDVVPFYRGPQQWLALVVTSLSRAVGQHLRPKPLEPLKRFILLGWVMNQHRFHRRNAVVKARSAHLGHRLGFLLFFATLVMGCCHLIGFGHDLWPNAMPLRRPAIWIEFLAMVLPVWAGAVHAITSQLELERIAERSLRMARALGFIAQRVTHARTIEELRNAANRAASVMIAENRDWWVLLSFQDVRLHV